MKQQLDELRQEIKEAKEEKTEALQQVGMKHPTYTAALQRLNKLEDQKFFLMQQLGESQPPESFVHAWRNRNLLPKKSLTFLKTIKRVPCILI
jgi:predicted nuclease with TOPRIM domain